MEKTDLAYMAGLFDGEGCIHIAKLRRPESKRGCHFGLVATIGMTSEFLLELYRSQFGGSVYCYPRLKGNRRPCWQWIIRSRQAVAFLKAIRPYLLLKANEADLAIEFQGAMHVGGRRIKEEWVAQETQYNLMRDLKFKTEVMNNG